MVAQDLRAKGKSEQPLAAAHEALRYEWLIIRTRTCEQILFFQAAE